MKVSIVTVCHNEEKRIRDTIESVAGQSYGSIEYIVIDGGSTDGTVDIIRKYDDSISYWVSEPDSGIYDAMNKGLEHASGTIVNFLNAGDRFYDMDVVANICKRFEEEPNTDVLIGRELIEDKVCKTYIDGGFKSVYFGAFFPHQATFSKTELYRNYRKFDRNYRVCADYDWILGAYYSGYKIKWVEDIVSVYESGGASSSYLSIAEQYNISSKYLKLSGDKSYGLEVANYYTEVFAKLYFINLMMENEKNSMISETLAVKFGGDVVDIWGAGNIGRQLKTFLNTNGITVGHILDSDASKHGTEIDNTPVCDLDGSGGAMIVISTTDYEDEVVNLLNSKGFCEHTDYVTFTDMSILVTGVLLDNGYNDGGFREKTGLMISRNRA